MKNKLRFTLTQSGDKSPHSIRIYLGFPRPERAKRLSGGRNSSKKCVTIKPCKGVRIMRATLSGLKILSNANVGLRPSLNRMALSGLFI